MRTIVTAARLWDGSRLIREPVMEIEDGRIAAIISRDQGEAATGHGQLDYSGGMIAPAYFDIHIHGAAGHDVMEATPEALGAISRFVGSRGTGTYLATTVTAPVDTTLRSLEGLAQRIAEEAAGEMPGARPVGIHLEGPFLSHAKRGVHPPACLLAPDIGVFDRLYEAAEGTIRLMTLAPELAGATELAAHATAKGVRVSLGHSNATAAETLAGIRAGACSATHTFNAMRALDHREPGILGTVLTTDLLYAELICDGIHVDQAMVRLWWRAKGAGSETGRGILVTDAISATGMPDGEYKLGGFAVQVANGRAMADGVLAGSVLTLDRAVSNFVRFTGASLEAALPLVTRNPVAMTGVGEAAGTLRVGGPASFVVLEEDGRLRASVLRGIAS